MRLSVLHWVIATIPLSSNMLLEVCANSLESALNAQEGGADRLELCQNLEVGGLTPDLETLKQVKKQVDIPVYVLIRCRAGDFHYTQKEIQLMEEQIRTMARLQFPGVVLGCLDSHQHIDQETTMRLMEAAGYMDVTFHRAFDEVPDVFEALDTLKELGIQRILTSAGPGGASENLDKLTELVEEAEDELIIMPGGGIRPLNIRAIMETGAIEFHSACMQSGENRVNVEMVQQLKKALS